MNNQELREKIMAVANECAANRNDILHRTQETLDAVARFKATAEAAHDRMEGRNRKTSIKMIALMEAVEDTIHELTKELAKADALVHLMREQISGTGKTQ